MIVNYQSVIDALYGLVGWKDDMTGLQPLSPQLKISETGLYYNDSHPLLTVGNMEAVASNIATSALSAYSATTAYDKGSLVSSDGKAYKAIDNTLSSGTTGFSTDDQPGGSKWVQTTLFSEWLLQKTRGSISKVLNRFYDDKLKDKMSKSLIDRRKLFDGTGRLVDTVENGSRIVGFELTNIRDRGVSLKINSIIIQTDGTGNIPVYIYHSSKYDPYITLNLLKTQKGSQEFKLDGTTYPELILPYSSPTTSPGGTWYIVYKQSEIGSQKAVNMGVDWSKPPCMTCTRYAYLNYMAWSKFFELLPFYVPESASVDQGLWDVTNDVLAQDNNFGLNLDISVMCDISDLIIENKSMFQTTIMYQVAIDMLKEFIFNANVRINKGTINASKGEIMYEINGSEVTMKVSGLQTDLERSYAALNINTKGVDRICLTCRNNGLRMRAV